MITKRLRMNKCCSCQKLASFVLFRLFNFCLAACTTKAQLIAFKFSRREAGSCMQVCQTELCSFYILFYSILFCIIFIYFFIHLSIYLYSNFSNFVILPALFFAQALQSTQVFVCRCNKGWRRLFLYTTSLLESMQVKTSCSQGQNISEHRFFFHIVFFFFKVLYCLFIYFVHQTLKNLRLLLQKGNILQNCLALNISSCWEWLPRSKRSHSHLEVNLW